MSNLENNSKLMAYILRHKPEKFSIQLETEGWALIEDLVENTKSNEHALTRAIIEEVVATDEKGRYQLSEDGLKVRAVQGHSTKQVDIKYSVSAVPPVVLYHGTAAKNKDSILKHGIQSMNRQYVHLSDDIDTATEVGRRHGVPTVALVDCKAMLKDGHKFALAPNGLWLVDEVPPKYISFQE